MSLPAGIDPKVRPLVEEALSIACALVARDQMALQHGLEHAFRLGFEAGRIAGIDDMDKALTKRFST